MAYNYPKVDRNNDQTYGPTSRKHYYVAVSYHNPTARKRPEKNRWCLIPPCQFEVFRVAELHYEQYYGDGGLYGYLDDANEVLGKDNEERFAFFPEGGTSPWHGYPIKSSGISNDIVKRWYKAHLISLRTYRDILKREI